MNCANHPGIPAVAYCRTCGKPLCATCKRDVMGVIYCEQCLAARLQDVQPPSVGAPPGFVSPAPIGGIPVAGPHPAVAGILAGFFPFGVGAVYTGQYAKGLAHLLIFTGLVWGLSSGHAGSMEPVLGIALGFFVLYQVIDAVRSAHAVRMGEAPPDPFGFNRTFGMVDRTAHIDVPLSAVGKPAPLSAQPKIPTAAVVLIGLGVLFLLNTAGIFDFNTERIWPIFLILLGVWMFINRSGMLAHGYNERLVYSRRVWSGPIWLITIGGLFLIQSFDGPGFGRTWPVLLLVVGLMKLLDTKTTVPVQIPGPPPPSTPSATDTFVNNEPPEVKNG